MSLPIFSVHSLIHFQSGMDGSVNSSASWQETSRDFSLLPIIDDFFFPFPTDLRRITAEISNPDNDNLIPG